MYVLKSAIGLQVACEWRTLKPLEWCTELQRN